MIRTRTQSGMTLIELLIASAVFLVVAVALYQTYVSLFRTVSHSRVLLSASSLATELFEVVRNMPYDDVGVSGSIPNGVLPHVATYARDGVSFVATTTVRNIDDPFDGEIGGSPNDLSPADYKLVQVEIGCPGCRTFSPLVFTTTVAPKNLEIASTNGALFIRVFDANGQPVQGASVHVENNVAAPAITIDDVTSADGLLQLIDVPPATEGYEITVTKAGYSRDQTYTPGDPSNPNPLKPHTTVVVQQVTQVSFFIDTLSSLNVQTVTPTCSPVGSIDFDLAGAKLIGSSPDVLKYSRAHVTDSGGAKTITDLEWDTYAIDVTDTAYDLAGLIPLLPPTLAPDSHLDLQIVVTPTDPDALLVTVKDIATQLPITDATVDLDGGETKTTGRGFLGQTDWSGGPGQDVFVDETSYGGSDGNIDVSTVPGTMTLDNFAGSYVASGELESSAFDTGSASNFFQIQWEPTNQPVEAGADSVRFQVATADEATATTTWDYLGPDGTNATYYTLADQNIASVHNGHRYFRYKVYLTTADTTVTPTLSDISFVFTSSCVPPGQVVFGSVGLGTHVVTVTKDGYQTYTSEPFALDGYFTSHEVSLVPN